MREIEFRGKRKDNGEWVYGDLQILGKRRAIFGGHEGDNLEKFKLTYEIDPKTVGEYTGLKDKTGKKIFEGDIVLFNKNHYEIVYHDCSFSLYKAGDVPQNILSKLYMDKFTVIGNIHDNPELLKETCNA